MTMIKTMITATHTRPCWVDGRRAIFHRWTDSARPAKARGMEDDENAQRFQLYSVHALVEFEDGTLQRVWPTAVQFADSEQYFTEYDWDTMEEAVRSALPYTFDEVAEEKPAGDIVYNCLNCGATPARSNCDYNCAACGKDGCRCRCCENGNLWVPKVGSAL